MPILNSVDPVYTNEIQIMPGPFDIELEFRMRPYEERAKGLDGDYNVVARVTMSLSHAKSMLPLLAKVVADYETQFGEIPVPGFGEFGRQ